MDIFGLMVLGFVTAQGGGLVRDILLNNVPIALTSNLYFVITLISIGFAITLLPLKVSIRNSVIHAADAIGTGAFAVTGVINRIKPDAQLGPVSCPRNGYRNRWWGTPRYTRVKNPKSPQYSTECHGIAHRWISYAATCSS